MTRGAHEVFVEHQTVDAPSDRKFGLTLGAMFLGLAGVRLLLGHGGIVTDIFAGVGALLMATGAVMPPVLGPFNRAWMKLGAIMAGIVNPAIMLMMFAFVFTPIALVMRWAGRDALSLRRKPTGASYWHEHDARDPAADRLMQQF